MRIALLLSGCFSGGDIESMNNSEPPPAQSSLINEAVSCPSKTVDSALVRRLVDAMNDNGNGTHSLSFVRNNKRYMIQYTPESSVTVISEPSTTTSTNPSTISIAENPDGTDDPMQLDSYVDRGADGCVNSGVSGKHFQLLYWNDARIGNSGLEHHLTWQARYNAAILAAADALNVQ